MKGNQRPTFILHTRKTVLFFCAIMILLIVADLVGLYSKYILGHPRVFGLVPLFDFDGELTVPAFFSTCLFLVNALLFLCVWKASRVTRESQYIFLFLSCLFLYLAIDEFLELHGNIVIPMQKKLHVTGAYSWEWVIPYGIGVVLLSIVMFPVLWRMDRKPRFWFFLSAATYVSGAIGGEVIAAWYLAKKGFPKGGDWGGSDFGYQFLVLYEESFEMAGLIMLTDALLILIRSRYEGISILIPGAHDASHPP